MAGNNILTKEDLNTLIEQLFQKIFDNSWSQEIVVQGLPKPFDKDALKEVLIEANNTTFKLLSEATGIAYMRDHSIVERSDCTSAATVKNLGGLDQVIDHL